MNDKDKKYIESMISKMNWSDESNDKANLYYMTCILQRVIDWSEADRQYFDEHYAFTQKFNMHGYVDDTTYISLTSNGIRISNQG